MFGTIGADKKQFVGLTVTPNLGLEACVYDKNTKEIVKYGQKFIEYNIASKEIQDINAFRSAVYDIFNELDIQKENANAYLVLPNVHFGFRSFDDPTMNADAIESMILSEASESYIFKQQEPISSWVDVNAKTGVQSKYIAHSSFQTNVVEDLENLFADMGIGLAGIETSTTAIPRGVAVTGVCDDVINANEEWDILLINTNGYAIFQMCGNRLLDYLEVPFAIMSFDGDEVYPALSSAVGQYLPNYPAKKLVIASLTDNVSANVLKNEITFDEEIVSIDSNSFSSEPCAKVSTELEAQAASMSLCAVGAACPKYASFAALNVLKSPNLDGSAQYGSFTFGDNEISITSAWVSKVCIIISAILGVITIAVAGVLFGVKEIYYGKYLEQSSKVSTLEKEVNELQSKVKTSVSTLVKQISENNKLAINYYDSLSSDIPQNLWLSYYINKDGTEVGIEGYSLEINDIYEYFNGLKILAPMSEIKLNKLEVFKNDGRADNSDLDSIVLDSKSEQQIFSFQISNSSYQKSFDDKGNAQGQGNNSQTRSPAARIPNVPDVEINLKEIE